MPIATKILNRVIGVQFYQRNAGLFLFIFYPDVWRYSGTVAALLSSYAYQCDA